jgi:hypothetical protein
MKLSNNAIIGLFGLIFWQVFGLAIGKILFWVVVGFALVAANKDSLHEFLFTRETASIITYLKSAIGGFMGAFSAEMEKRGQYVTFEEKPRESPREATSKEKNKLPPYWYIDQYQIKEICGIGQDSSIVRSWKELCNGEYLYSPHISGKDSPNQKLHYSVEAIISLSAEFEQLLNVVGGDYPFNYWYKNEGEWHKGSYSPI